MSIVCDCLTVRVHLSILKRKEPVEQSVAGAGSFLSDTEKVSMPYVVQELLNHLDQVIPADKQNRDPTRTGTSKAGIVTSTVLRRQRDACWRYQSPPLENRHQHV